MVRNHQCNFRDVSRVQTSVENFFEPVEKWNLGDVCFVVIFYFNLLFCYGLKGGCFHAFSKGFRSFSFLTSPNHWQSLGEYPQEQSHRPGSPYGKRVRKLTILTIN